MRNYSILATLLMMLNLPLLGADVWGTVTERVNGNPVPNAYIEIFYFNPESVYVATGYADLNGHYSFTGVPAGTYFLNSWTTGFDASRFYNVSVPSEGLRLDILLAPPVGVDPGGIVVGQDSTPVPEAHMVWTHRVSGTDYLIDTDVAGAYSLKNLPLGSYDVTVSATGYETVAFTAAVQGGFSTYGIVLVPTTTTSVEEQRLPEGDFRLLGTYPNPFNPATTIRYLLPTEGTVRLAVYNAAGQLVKLLLDEPQRAGERSVRWEAGDLPSGVYVFQLAVSLPARGERSTLSGKLMLVK